MSGTREVEVVYHQAKNHTPVNVAAKDRQGFHMPEFENLIYRMHQGQASRPEQNQNEALQTAKRFAVARSLTLTLILTPNLTMTMMTPITLEAHAR